MAEFFLENGADVEVSDAEGRTALHVSCWQGHLEMVQLLVTYHANINASDNEKRSALQSASWQGQVKVVQYLIDQGALVDHTCNQGATALCIAAQEGHVDVVQLLLENGGDPNHADQFGRTAMRVAAKNGHSQIIKLLEKYGASTLNGCTPNPVHTMEQKASQQTTTKIQSLTIKSNSSSSTGGGDVPTNVHGLSNGPVHAFSSPSESPDSTVDRQKDSLSNNSLKSSKNSSLRTTSSTASAQTVPIDSFHNLSFTEQIQQHSLPRSRSRQSIISPSSTTQSIGKNQSSPISEFEWSQVKPSLKSTKSNKGGKTENSVKSGSIGKKTKPNNCSQPKVLEYEMKQFDKRGPTAKSGTNVNVSLKQTQHLFRNYATLDVWPISVTYGRGVGSTGSWRREEELETHFTLTCQSPWTEQRRKRGSNQEPVNILEVGI